MPAAPAEAKSFCDIFEVVDELLVMLHCSVNPDGTSTDVATAMPTAWTNMSLAVVVVTPVLSTLQVDALDWA